MSKIKLLLEQLELLVEKKDHLINRIDTLTSAQKDEIISFFQKYPQHESKINWNNINELTYDDFKKVMIVPDTITIKSGEAVEGTDYIEVDSLHKFHKAFIPLNWEGSKYLASNAVGGMEGKWCIAYREADDHWDFYANKSLFVIYVTPKGKYALQIARRGHELENIWNKRDEIISRNTFNDETGNDVDDLIEKNNDSFLHPLLKVNPFTPDYAGSINANKMGLTSLEGAPEIVDNHFFCNGNNLKSLIGAPKIVRGSFVCKHCNLISLEGAPSKIWHTFNCDNNKLKSLIGAPVDVTYFSCENNLLKTLKGAPEEIKGHFNCSNNELENLVGAPKEVEKDFNCSDNKLTSLEGAPEFVGGEFNCSSNKLISLKGAPGKVDGRFDCSSNELTSIEGAPEEVYIFDCAWNNLTSLKGAPKIVELSFSCNGNNLISLEGAPEKVGGSFHCKSQKNGHKFTEEEVRAVCAVKGNVYV